MKIYYRKVYFGVFAILALHLVLYSVAAVGAEVQTRYATSVIEFSRQYDSPDYAATQALGAPDVFPDYSDDELAWASWSKDGYREFLSLAYAAPIQVQSIVIYETYNPGAVDRVELRDAGTGDWNEVWTGTAASAGSDARAFIVAIPKTAYLVSGVRIELDCTVVSGRNEIDAIAIMDGDATSLGPTVSIQTASRVDELYTELGAEPVEITCAVSDLITGVSSVTIQLLDPAGQPVGDEVAAVRERYYGSTIYQDNWVGTITIPQGAASGNYGVRVSALSVGGAETLQETSALLTVTDLLPRPSDVYELVKVLETGDATHSFGGKNYRIDDFGLDAYGSHIALPMINNNGQIAFEARVVSDGVGVTGVPTYLWDDGILTVLIDGPVTGYSGTPASLNDSGWVAFSGSASAGPFGSFIYKSNGTNTTLIDDTTNFSDPSINESGEVAYLMGTTEIWVGDGTNRLKLLEDGLSLPVAGDGYSAPIFTTGATRHILSLYYPRIDNNGRVVFYGVTKMEYPNYIQELNGYTDYYTVVGTTTGGGFRTKQAAGEVLASYGVDQIVFPQDIAVSGNGKLAFAVRNFELEGVAVIQHGDLFNYNTTSSWLSGGIGINRGFANGITGQAVNDYGGVAFTYLSGKYWLSGELVGGKRLIRSPGRIPILQSNNYLDGRRVARIELGLEGINNRNEIAFLVEFLDGHEALYLARPVILGGQAVFAFPPSSVIETVPGGLLTYYYLGAPEGWLELPPRGEVTMTVLTSRPARGIREISAIADHLANPAEIVVDGSVVGTIHSGERFDLEAVTGTAPQSVTLRQLTVSPKMTQPLAIQLQFDYWPATLQIAGAGVPLLIQPAPQAFRSGDRMLLQSGAIDPAGTTFQWSKNGVGNLTDGSNMVGTATDTFDRYPYETGDAGTYTLTGTGPDGPASVAVPIVNGQSFADWISHYYPAAGNNQNIVGSDASPLGDGISNIIKYAFGIDPTQPLTNADRARFASVNRVIAGSSNRMELNFTLNPAATDIAFGFEVASTVSGPWEEVESQDLVVTESGSVNGREVTVLLPPVSDEQQYYRVNLGYAGD
jgi:hypothetical protein